MERQGGLDREQEDPRIKELVDADRTSRRKGKVVSFEKAWGIVYRRYEDPGRNDIHQAAVDDGLPTSSSAIPAASLTVIEDIEVEHFNDSYCETLPELGGRGSNVTVNDLQYGDQLTPD
ncbi:hypothetical protein ElyMa_003270500 [Elysia marginata]|uniref:Uncharacterized protein n=1 Tax=Elysia marginata TaxID=1093978 RepID=A0AAV4JBJ3_9GAST|nr:hypothetical protein ElyMa_003270500 [Elysia marginata]